MEANISPRKSKDLPEDVGTSPSGRVSFHSPDEVVFSGCWLRTTCRQNMDEVLAQLPTSGQMRLTCRELQQWDSTLLIALAQLLEWSRQHDTLQVELSGLPPGIARLMELSRSAATTPLSSVNPHGWLRRMLDATGLAGMRVMRVVLAICAFVGELSRDLLALLVGRSCMRAVDLCRQVVNCGPRALGIIALISFLMGLILAFIGAIPLRWFQAEVYVASLVGIGMLRLMAPVMVGIVMAGRTAAAFAAELGTMQVNEENDALRTLGISPMQLLILPRFLAMGFTLPLLCVVADICSILGGMVVAEFYLDISPLSFFSTLFSTTRLNDLLVGIFTAWVLALLDAICGCYQGINCGRSAAAVGNATTRAVVSSIVCIVIAVSIITVGTVVLKI